MSDKKTGAHVAAHAGKILGSSKNHGAKSVAASALSQRPGKRK